MHSLLSVVAAFSLLSAPPKRPGFADLPLLDAQKAAHYGKVYGEVETKIRSGALASALKQLEELDSIYGEDGNVAYYLGQARHAAKDYDGAIASLQKALKLGAFSAKFRANCLYDLACAYTLKGDTKKGFEFLEQSMAAGFRDLAHLREDTDLEALHKDSRWEVLAATKDVSKLSRNEGWRYDLWLLDREMRRIHYSPYRVNRPEEFARFVKDLDRRIPKLTDSQIGLEFMKYAVMLGDGHTSVSFPADSALRKTVPLQAFWFEDGVFVTAAAPDYRDLAGAQILKVEGRTIAEISDAMAPSVWRDNPQGLKNAVPHRMMMPAMMHAAGLAVAADKLMLTVRDREGRIQDVTLRVSEKGVDDTWITSRDGAERKTPLYLANRAKPYFFQVIPELKAVYLQYNAVRSDPNEPMAAFCEKLFAEIDKSEIERLIVDVRWNGGGNSFLNRNIQDGILARPKVNRSGRFFLITGRNTFSAAQNFTTDLVRNANPILVGEPTGSSPNFVGETVRVTLPYSKMNCSISDLYWQRSWPMDHRIWLAPQIPAPPVFALYRENRDPALEAIQAFLESRS